MLTSKEDMQVIYCLMIGYETCHDDDEWIGCYTSLNKLESAYRRAELKLKSEVKSSKKLWIHIFFEAEEQWKYNVDPRKIFNGYPNC